MISQHGAEDNNKIRLYAKMTGVDSDTGNTLKSGYPQFLLRLPRETRAESLALDTRTFSLLIFVGTHSKLPRLLSKSSSKSFL